MRNLRHYIKSPWRPSLIIIIGSIVGIVFIALLRKDPNLASALVAFGTLLLAIVTAMVIDNSRQQEKRRKKEGLLNEIIEWADSIARSAINRQKTTQPQFWKTKLEYKFWMAKIEYVTAITTTSFKDLLPCVENINKEIGKAINATEEAIKMKKTTNNLKCSEEKLTEAVKELFKKAAKIKTTDIEQKEGNMSKEDEATGSNEPTLKDIEDHLKQQDIQMKKGTYFTGAAFGGAIALIGVSFMVQRSFQLSPQVYIWFLITVGLCFMFWCRWKPSKVKYRSLYKPSDLHILGRTIYVM